MLNRKVSAGIWGDKKFRRLTDYQRLVWFYILTGPHNLSMPGIFQGGPASLAENMGAALEDFGPAFDAIMRQELMEWDPGTNVIYLPKALKHNPPYSPNQVKRWSKELEIIPDCPIKVKYYLSLKAFLEGMGEGFREALTYALPEGLPDGPAPEAPAAVREAAPPRPAPRPPSRKPRREYPLSFDGKHIQGVTDDMVARWSGMYPEVNVRREIAKAEDWLVRKGKRKKDYASFLVGWFGRSDPDPGLEPGPSPEPETPEPAPEYFKPED